MIKNARVRQVVIPLAAMFILLSSVFVGPTRVHAQVVPVKITSFQVSSVDGRAVGTQPLMAGATYRVSFTLEVAAGVRDKITLKTDLARVGDRYWTLSGNYTGIDIKTWQPGQPELPINPVEGKVQLELQGAVPENFVLVKSASQENLHIGKPIVLLQVSLPGARVIETRSQEAIDKSIETYRAVLVEKQALSDNATADSRYVALVDALITASKSLAGSGYTENATVTLKAIPQSGWIVAQPSTWYQWVIIGVLAVVCALVLFALFRSKSEMDFARRHVEDQARRLEILSSRARNIGDARLSGDIDKVKKDLEEMSGRQSNA